VRIEIPNGIEFERAEIGSASTRAMAAILLNLKDSYGQFNVLPFRHRCRALTGSFLTSACVAGAE
jgi:hypothetical protein